MRALWTIALGSLLLGCVQPDPDTCVSATPQPSFVNGARFVPAGASVDLEVVLPPTRLCTQGLPVCSGVDVQVLDPQGNPITPTVGAVSVNPSRGYAVHVGFTVSSVGQYLVRVRFEPSLGVVQAFAEGAVDFTRQAWEPAPAGWDTCESVVALQDGALGCRRLGGLELWSQGRAPQRIEGDVRAAGGGLWATRGGTLERYARGDGGFVLRSVVSVPTNGNQALLDTREDAVLLGLPPTLVRLGAGGPALLPLNSLEAPLDQTQGGVISLDGGLRLLTPMALCEVSAPPAPASVGSRCESFFSAGAMSVSAAGLWSSRQTNFQELLLLPRGGGTVTFDSSPLVASASFEQVPLLRGGAQVFLPVQRGSRLGLEAWQGPPGASIRSADDGVLFAVRDGEAFFSRRPAP